MLPTTISRKLQDSGTELSIPPNVMASVERITEILNSELGDLVERFNLALEWRFSFEPTGLVPHLVLTSNGHVAMVLSFPASTLKNDETILRNLRPALVELGFYFSGLLRQELRELRLKLAEDRESFAALLKE